VRKKKALIQYLLELWLPGKRYTTPHLVTTFGENEFLFLFGNRLPRYSTFPDSTALFVYLLIKGKNTEVHKSQISKGVLFNCAEPMATPGRGEFHLPGLLLCLGEEGGGRLSSLQALPAHDSVITIPQRLLDDVLRLICSFLMICDASTQLYL